MLSAVLTGVNRAFPFARGTYQLCCVHSVCIQQRGVFGVCVCLWCVWGGGVGGVGGVILFVVMNMCVPEL